MQSVSNTADAIGEQQLKWTQSGSSSQSGSNRGAEAEVDANGEQQLSNAIGERQLKQTQSRTESCLAPDYTCRRTSGSS